MSIHHKTHFFLNGTFLTPSQLVDIQASESWLSNVIRVVKFCMGNEDHFTFITSGSTGRPKSIVHPRQRLLASAQTTLDFFGLAPGSKAALVLPAGKTGGIMMIVRACLGGLSLDLHKPSLDISTMSPVDFLPCTPAQFESIIHVPAPKAKTVLLGGAPVPADLVAPVESEVYVGYGMTETASHVALRNLKDPFYTAVGSTTFSTESGRLIINAPHLGISNLLTNDGVELLSPKTFSFVGRTDFIINSGGVKIQPEEVELQLSKQGVQAYLTSISNATFGEELVLAVLDVPKDLKSAVASLKAAVKPKRYVQLSEFPKVGGKVNRKALKELAQELTPEEIFR